MLSSVQANKLAKSALDILALSVGYSLSKSTIDILEKILTSNGDKMSGGLYYSKKKGGSMHGKMKKKKGGAKPSEVKMLEEAAVKLLKVAMGYELSKAVLDRMAKLLHSS